MPSSAASAPPPVLTARSLLMVNLAVALFGLAGVLGQLTGLPSPLVTLGRALSGALALLLFGLWRGADLRLPGWVLLLLGGQGLLLAVHWTAFFQSIAVAGVAVGLLTFATFPLFTAPLEWLLLRSHPDRLQLGGALGIVLGVWVLVPDPSLQDASTRGVAWGLIGAATFALLAVLNRWTQRLASSLTASLYQNGVAALVLLPLLAAAPVESLLQPRTLGLLLVLGVGCTAVAHTLFIAGLRRMTAQLASLLAGLEPVWGILLAVLMLDEWPTSRALLGGTIIVASTMLPVALAYWRPARAAP
ncbi:MAG: DMT family transporter [Chloroflexi bacterium]|nr:DMT family transporter [Chloroflexota bacterium]